VPGLKCQGSARLFRVFTIKYISGIAGLPPQQAKVGLAGDPGLPPQQAKVGLAGDPGIGKANPRP